MKIIKTTPNNGVTGNFTHTLACFFIALSHGLKLYFIDVSPIDLKTILGYTKNHVIFDTHNVEDHKCLMNFRELYPDFRIDFYKASRFNGKIVTNGEPYERCGNDSDGAIIINIAELPNHFEFIESFENDDLSCQNDCQIASILQDDENDENLSLQVKILEDQLEKETQRQTDLQVASIIQNDLDIQYFYNFIADLSLLS